MKLSLIMVAAVALAFVFNFLLAKILAFSNLVRRTYLSYFLLFFLSLLLLFVDSRIASTFLIQIDQIRFYLLLAALLTILHLCVKSVGLLFFDYFFAKRRLAVPRLLKDVVLFILYLTGILLIFNFYLKIRVTVFLASSAVLTIVIGLALQDILGNIFSGMILNFEHILKQGDWIRVGDHDGRIEQFGWRSIVIRDLDKNQLIIPNQSASKTEIKVFGPEQESFYLRLEVGVSYRHPPDYVIGVIREALEAYDQVLKDPPSSIFVLEFDQSAVVYQLKYAIQDYGARNAVASEIRRRLWYAFRRAAIEIPFPIRTVYMREEESRALSGAEKSAILGRIPILQLLEPQKFSEIADKAEETIFGKGELILREGDRSPSFYQVVSGSVEVLKGNSRVAQLKEGEFFGEISVVTGDCANASVYAAEETRLLAISAGLFRSVIEMNRELAEKLAAVISTRQHETAALKKSNVISKKAASKIEVRNKLLERIIKYFGIH